MFGLSWVKMAIYAAILASITGTYFVWQTHERNIGAAPWKLKLEVLDAALTLQKETATKLLLAEKDKAEATTKQLELALITQEKNDELGKQKVTSLNTRVSNLLAANNGRLRDPAGGGGCSSSTASKDSTNTTNSPADRTDARGLLSPELSRLLWDRFEKADRINLAFASCKIDSTNLRAALKQITK